MESEKFEQIWKRWGLRIFILFMSISIAFIVFKYSKPSVTSQYAKQAINILRDLKNTTITADESYTKIETLENRINEEMEKLNLNENKRINLLNLNTKLRSISKQLLEDKDTRSSKSFTISEIDEYITELKKYH